MKQKKHCSSPHAHLLLLPLTLSLIVFIFIILIISINTAAAAAAKTITASTSPHTEYSQHEGNEALQFDNFAKAGGHSEDVPLDYLMGWEHYCEDGDEEECLKRRMMSEAHLDYIYTQHHKP